VVLTQVQVEVGDALTERGVGGERAGPERLAEPVDDLVARSLDQVAGRQRPPASRRPVPRIGVGAVTGRTEQGAHQVLLGMEVTPSSVAERIVRRGRGVDDGGGRTAPARRWSDRAVPEAGAGEVPARSTDLSHHGVRANSTVAVRVSPSAAASQDPTCGTRLGAGAASISTSTRSPMAVVALTNARSTTSSPEQNALVPVRRPVPSS
jgi:hypothetical protein